MNRAFLFLCALLLSACTFDRFPVELTLEVEADGQPQRITRNTECVSRGTFSGSWEQHSRIVHPLPEGGYLLFGIGETYCIPLSEGSEVTRSEAGSFTEVGWTDDFRNPSLVVFSSVGFEDAESPPRVKPSTLSFTARRMETAKPSSKELADDALVRWFGFSRTAGGSDGRDERLLLGGAGVVLPRAQWEKVAGASELFRTFDLLATVPRSHRVFDGLRGVWRRAIQGRRNDTTKAWDDVGQHALRKIGENNWTIDWNKPGTLVFEYIGPVESLSQYMSQNPALFEGVDISKSDILYDPRSDEVIIVGHGLVSARGGS